MKLNAGDRIRLTEEQFNQLATAFLTPLMKNSAKILKAAC